MIVYRCTDSAESVFTAVYRAYQEKRNHEETFVSLTDDPVLFAEDVPVKPDPEKAQKVVNTLVRRFGEDDYVHLCMALASDQEDRAQAVYRTVVDGLGRKCPRGHLFDSLANDYVHRAFALARGVSREAERQKQFLRFQELESGLMYARIGPKNNVMAFIMPHFADRLPIVNFAVHDEKHSLFGIHPAGGQWYLLQGEGVEGPIRLQLAQEEGEYQERFRQLCRSITIDQRKNWKLQRNMLPLRFREYMVEFDSGDKVSSCTSWPRSGLRRE